MYVLACWPPTRSRRLHDASFLISPKLRPYYHTDVLLNGGGGKQWSPFGRWKKPVPQSLMELVVDLGTGPGRPKYVIEGVVPLGVATTRDQYLGSVVHGTIEHGPSREKEEKRFRPWGEIQKCLFVESPPALARFAPVKLGCHQAYRLKCLLTVKGSRIW